MISRKKKNSLPKFHEKEVRNNEKLEFDVLILKSYYVRFDPYYVLIIF